MSQLTYLSGVKIAVADLDRSIEFYSQVLDLRLARRLRAGGIEEAIMAGAGGSPVILAYDGAPPRSAVTLAFFVDDPAERLRDIAARGLTVLAEATAIDAAAEVPAELAGVVVGFGTDPDGHVIELIQHAMADRMERFFLGDHAPA